VLQKANNGDVGIGAWEKAPDRSRNGPLARKHRRLSKAGPVRNELDTRRINGRRQSRADEGVPSKEKRPSIGWVALLKRGKKKNESQTSGKHWQRAGVVLAAKKRDNLDGERSLPPS